jgi:hypothetical protein
MAFLPQRNFVEETLVNSYNLSAGISAFTSTNISDYNIISFQINANGINGNTTFVLEQSLDNINWTPISEDVYFLDNGSGSLTIQKSNFSGKYIRLRLTNAGSGTISVFLLSKR